MQLDWTDTPYDESFAKFKMSLGREYEAKVGIDDNEHAYYMIHRVTHSDGIYMVYEGTGYSSLYAAKRAAQRAIEALL